MSARVAHRPTVLLVEDHADTRELYALHLASAGFSTIEASDGLTGLARARNFQPDFIALDLAMPRVDGFDVCRQLKADPRTQHIPVVAVTGLSRSAALKQAIDAGCDAVLFKPCNAETLLATIRRTLVTDEPSAGDRQRSAKRPRRKNTT